MLNLVAHIEGGGPRLRMFKNRVRRRIFWPRRDEVAREWRILNNEELNDLYSSTNIVWVFESRKWAGHVARMGESTGVYVMLVEKPEGKRPFRRPCHRWEDNIKMGLHDVGCEGMDLIDLAQDRNRWRALIKAVMNLRVP